MYYQNHKMQEQFINKTLTHYLPKLQQNKVSKILDIGCGSGDITHNYLLPLLLENGTLLGIDRSEKMIDYANSHYKGPKLSFELIDLMDHSIGKKYEETFELIFSFFCLHWIQDQKSAMENIYKMLKPGGECLLVILGTWPVFNMYEILARSPRWYPYVKDYKNFISPYHQIADPVRNAQNIIDEIGFQIKDCVHAPSCYIMPSEESFYQSMEALNPFISNVPDHLHEDYLEDCNRIIWKENFCSLKPTKEVDVPYTTVTIHAKKL